MNGGFSAKSCSIKEKNKMADKVKIGIIGCGGIANGKHLRAISNIDFLEPVAFCDIIEERAIELAKKYGAENAKVYTDYKELLKDESIVAVHVCTPNKSHSFISIDAMEAGKHVLCEKPMAKTYAEAKAMYEASVRTGKVLKSVISHVGEAILSILRNAAKTMNSAKSITQELLHSAEELFPLGAYSLTKKSRAAVPLSISELMLSTLLSG